MAQLARGGLAVVQYAEGSLLLSGVSMALGKWATRAVESRTTDLMNDGSKSGRVATIWEKEETDLTLRPILGRVRPELGLWCLHDYA